jgi:Tol biopolymer transport system component
VRHSCILVVLALGSAAHADRLTEPRLVVRGDYQAPRFSPDGRDLLLTGPKLRGLHLVPVAGGQPRTLTDEAEAGVHARWLPDGSIAYRAPRAGVRRELELDRAGAIRLAPVAAPPIAFAKDDRMYVQRGGRLVEIGSGDRFFGAVVSPDGERVVFQGLVTGLYVYTRSTGAIVRIGPGTAPAWSPDSRRIAFEVTEDDGHQVVASELHVHDVAAGRAAPITATDRVIERRPSFSPDGASLAFDDDAGGVLVGRLAP